MRSKTKLKNAAKEIFFILTLEYPEAECSLDHEVIWQLLISTILSAQCTDVRVNIVTKDLFKKYTSISDFAMANPAELEMDIKSTGFYKNKTKNIISCCQKILRDFDGQIPSTMEELLTLAGVGRKTANVILGTYFNTPGIIVDTHCGRLARRIGLTQEEDPEKVERALMEILPKENWTMFSHFMVYHGRAICNARKPKCSECKIGHLCDSFPA